MSATRGRRDRLWLSVVTLALALWLGAQAGLGRLDAIIYDTFALLLAPAVANDPVVVAIDEASLRQHGRWPWDRHLYADLIERISADEPLAIGLDLLLSEPAPGEQDAALAAALQRSGKVVLPVFTAAAAEHGVQAMLPVPELAAAAHALGHVSVQTDIDGVARSIFLREGLADQIYNHIAVELLALAGRLPGQLPGVRAPVAQAIPGVWQRDHWLQLAFPVRGQTVPTVSAADVLAGEVEPDRFRGRIVLVGVTAGGLGDTYPTPVAQAVYTPGVQVLATAVANLEQGHGLVPASALANAGFTLVLVLLLLPVYWRASPRVVLGWTLICMLAALVASAVAWESARIWFAPAAALVVCLAAYPFWSWRRLETASAWLDQEIGALRSAGALLPAGSLRGDAVDRRIQAMGAAAANLRALNAFIATTIENLPDIALVADAQGRVQLANRAAAHYAGVAAPTALEGVALAQLLCNLRERQSQAPLPGVLDGVALECLDEAGREFLFKAVSCPGTRAEESLNIVILTDLARVRQAERARDEALRFLSHDLRAPLASIRTLVQSAPEQQAAERDARIARLAAQALELAEGFVQLARAESAPMRHEPVDLVELVMDAEDACWAAAQSAGVQIKSELGEEPVDVIGERSWLARALINLLDNAVKFSPRGGTVYVSLVREADGWRLSVRDEGPGIALEAQAGLLKPFARANESRPGVGLGLAFVRAVAGRHGGRLELESQPGQGAEFSLLLPLHTPGAT